MARYSFERTEVVIYDPLTSSRDMGRAALYNLGFRLIESVATIDGFAGAIRRRPKDLVLCEARGAEAQICETIQSLRRDATAYNPFVVIIVTAWEKSNGLVNRIVNSGADDLLLRPFSTGRLGQHIEAHIELRKPFVVTTDYVGPDRRANDRRDSNITPFVPPNSLKVSVTEPVGFDAAKRRFDDGLRSARHNLKIEKLRCDAFQMCVFWRVMHEDASASLVHIDEMAKIASLAKAVESRLDAPECENAIKLCRSVPATLNELQVSDDRAWFSTMLGQSLFALLQAFQPDMTETEQRNRVDVTVAAINQRRRLSPVRARIEQDNDRINVYGASAS